MQFREQTRSLLRQLKVGQTGASLFCEMGDLYWKELEENVLRRIGEKSEVEGFLSSEYDFVNFGVTPEALENAPEISGLIGREADKERPITISFVSEWLSETYKKCMAGDRREALQRESALANMHVRRLEREIVVLQQHRREVLLKELGAFLSPEALGRHIEHIETADKLFRQRIILKKMSSKGIFLPAEEKRKHCERENEYAACRDLVEKFYSSVHSPEVRASLKQCSGRVRETVIALIDAEDAVMRLENDIADIAKKQSMISTAELSASMRREILYLKDLATLSAKRAQRENCGVLKPGDVYFTVKDIRDCLDRITKFDPLLFNNPRVAIFGIPRVLVVPGAGNALYDWKNNRIVLPLTAPSGDFLASVAHGMIEYRLDVDENRQLLASYGKLPRHAAVKSTFHLKSELTKDYITWMTSEYLGYKNLERETRKWFEHEIAPDKNDIVVPLELRPFYCTVKAFNDKYKEIESCVAKGVEACSQDVLWTGSILYYQRGKFDRAAGFLKALLSGGSGHADALYNLAHACMKLMRKQEAMDFFNEYRKRNPQSWWASVAMEHIRKLQTGHAT